MTMNNQQHNQDEEGVDIPLDRIDQYTLLKMIELFVTREWSELADADFSLEEKVAQVLSQLKSHRARIVYDSRSETWNIIPCR